MQLVAEQAAAIRDDPNAPQRSEKRATWWSWATGRGAAESDQVMAEGLVADMLVNFSDEQRDSLAALLSFTPEVHFYF